MTMKSLTRFFKKYGYYAVGFMLLLAIGVTALMTSAGNKVPDGDIIDVGTETISFRLPMNDLTVLKEYTLDHIENKTLKNWTTHRAYSLTSADLKVFAIARGKVETVSSDFEHGNFVIIAHEDGVRSYYGSLDKNILVSVGSNVEKGQALGTASDTAENYSLDGNHLLFRMYNEDKLVNPATYLNFTNK